MNYRLLVFKFTFLDDRYIFPIIINHSDLIKSGKEKQILNDILQKLQELPGLETPVRILDEIGDVKELQKLSNSIFSNVSIENIKTIDIELRKSEKVNLDEVYQGVFKKFTVKEIHFPIKKLDNFNEIDINPFVVIEI